MRTMVLVAEGLPPIPAKLLERIRRWEFIDLAQLVFDASKDDPGIRQQPPSEGILIVQSMEQMQRRRKAVNDIFTWSKAFAIYTAALSGAELTTKEECAGLWAHLHLVTQLSRDLGGGLWLQYDSEYREWAAAKGIRTWGKLNLSIYGHCLSNRLAYSTPPAAQRTNRGNSSAPAFAIRGISTEDVRGRNRASANLPTHVITVGAPTERKTAWRRGRDQGGN